MTSILRPDGPLYHLDDGTTCQLYRDGDELVPRAEALDGRADTRHFNCPACDHRRSSGQRHVSPPA